MRGFDRFDQAVIWVCVNLALFILGEVLADLGWWLSGGRFDDQPDWLWAVCGVIMVVGYRVCEALEERHFVRGLEADEDEDEG